MNARNLIPCLLLTALLCRAAPDNSAPKLDEVLQVLGANLPGGTPEDLNRASVNGLIAQLSPRVVLVNASGERQAGASSLSPLAQTRVFDQSFAYFRVATVKGNLAESFREAYHGITETNGGKVKGIILDLRFAGGTDYGAAAKMADCFVNSDQALLDWQQGSARATKKSDAILVPVGILINSQTAGAPEALAAALRELGAGLIVGSPSAGQASVFKEFPLSNGDKLRVAVAGVIVGDGKALTNSIVPDIAIDTSLQDERAYLQNPYKDLHPAEVAQADGTNNAAAEPRPRFNEAELVREHRAGEDTYDVSDVAQPVLAGLAEPTPPTVADPALSRALDLVKTLAVVEPNRPD